MIIYTALLFICLLVYMPCCLFVCLFLIQKKLKSCSFYCEDCKYCGYSDSFPSICDICYICIVLLHIPLGIATFTFHCTSRTCMWQLNFLNVEILNLSFISFTELCMLSALWVNLYNIPARPATRTQRLLRKHSAAKQWQKKQQQYSLARTQRYDRNRIKCMRVYTYSGPRRW